MTLLSAGIITEDDEAPTTPTNLAASNTTDTSTDLSWTASSDDESVAGYYVYRDGTQVQDVASTSTTVSGLSSGTTYSFAVSAYDDAGNESTQSASVQVTTESAVFFSDGFEDGTVDKWSGSPLSVTTDHVATGTYGGEIDKSGDYVVTATVDSSGVQPTRIRFRYWEQSSGSNGHGIRFRNSDGDYEFGIASANPNWVAWDASGFTGVSGGEYQFVTVDTSLDWSAGTYTAEWTSDTYGTTATHTGSFRNGVDIATIELNQFNNLNGGYNSGLSGDNAHTVYDDWLVE